MNNMEFQEDLFAPEDEFRIPNDENTDINYDVIMEPITPEHPEKISTIERALAEVDKYLKSIGENGDSLYDVMNGPNVHDCYKPLEIKVPSELENKKRNDSPRPKNKMRSNNLLCKTRIRGNSFEIIPKTCKLANIRRLIDTRRKVEFRYCPDIAQTKVINVECRTEIANPALLITLPQSKKVTMKLRSDNCT